MSSPYVALGLIVLVLLVVAMWRQTRTNRRFKPPPIPDWRQRYPPDWNVLRERVMERDANACTACGSRQKPLVCHHVVPLSQGGSNSPQNLRTLCDPCHRARHPHLLQR